MTTEEAKGLFALMGWQWEARGLAQGNNVRGKLDAAYQGLYEVFVAIYETYGVDECLTRYAELYLAWVAERPKERVHDRRG